MADPKFGEVWRDPNDGMIVMFVVDGDDAQTSRSVVLVGAADRIGHLAYLPVGEDAYYYRERLEPEDD